MKKLKKAILPEGFSSSGIYCGIKKSRKKDLGLIYSHFPCTYAGVFTASKVQAESLKVCVQQLKKAKVGRAIIVNSGNANCFVGNQGINDASEIIRRTAKQLCISEKSIFIASTGIIGRPLPFKGIKAKIPNLCQGLGRGRLKDFAESILTTDTFKKTVSVGIKIKNKPVLITGIAKGAGMIYPNLQKNSRHATMLAFVLTDAGIKKQLLESALDYVVDNSFNRISVDGCMSTNDTVLALANGAAAGKSISKKDKDFKLFSAGLFYVCSILSLMIVDDAEGGTKRIGIFVQGAKSQGEANSAANAVANSSLFKAAMFGANANFGRIVSAIGAMGIPIKQNQLQISLNKQMIFNKGRLNYVGVKGSIRHSRVIDIGIDLNRGKFSHNVYTSDLTPEYVKINAEYN